MDIKIGDYQIVADERQFVVKVSKKVTDKESENYGKDYIQNVAYCTSFDSALRFIPQQVLRSNDDITVIKDKLEQIQADIKALPNPIKVEVEKVVVKKEKNSDGDQITKSKVDISSYIKKRLGILTADGEYEQVKARVFLLLGISKWEDLDIESYKEILPVVDESIRIVKLDRPQ